MKHSFLLVSVCVAAAMMTLGALDTRAQSERAAGRHVRYHRTVGRGGE